MATKTEFNKKTFDHRRNRYFSEPLKKSIVRKIEQNRLTVREAADEMEVTCASVYNWVYKYSSLYKRGQVQVVESKSKSAKVKALQERIKELEQMVGQKQMELEFVEKMIEIAEEEFGIEIKKKHGSKPRSGSGKTGKK